MRKIKVISCVTTIAIMTLIFLFSSQSSNESSELSSGITHLISQRIVSAFDLKQISTEELAGNIHTFVRKCAHFTEYAGLGVAASVAYMTSCGTRKVSGVLKFICVFCMCYAVSDEIHQLFVPGRTMRLFDVFVDTCGGVTGSAVVLAVMKLRDKLKGVAECDS